MTDDSAPRWPGVPLALGSALLFGASTPFSKLLLTQAEPQILAGLLYLGAGLGLALVHLGRGRLGLLSAEAPLRRSDLPWLAAIVTFGGVAGPLLLMLGLARTEASSASLLLNLEGLATMVVAWLAFHENVDRRLLLGALAILAGAAIISWDGTGVRLDLGALLIAGACFSWGVDNNLTRKLSSSDPVIIAMIKGLAAGSVNVALALSRGVAALPSTIVAAAAAVGFLGIGVSLVLFVLALRHLGTARTGAYFSLAPFIGAVGAILMLHDPLTSRLVAAAALMGFGLWMHLSERHQHMHTHEALEHEHSHAHDEHHRHSHDGAVEEPHTHWHRHEKLTHAHSHYPDIHHRHLHAEAVAATRLRASARQPIAWVALALTAALAAVALLPQRQPVKPSEAPAVAEAGDRKSSAEQPASPAHEIPFPPSPATGVSEAPIDAVARALLAFLKGDATPQAATRRFYLDKLAFETGKPALALSAREQLREIAQILKGFPEVKVSLGDEGERDGLKRFKARIAAVRRELVRWGVSPSQLVKTPGKRRDAPPAGVRGVQRGSEPIFLDVVKK